VWPNENSSSNGTFSSFANFPKYFCINLPREGVIAGGNRSVRGENIRRCDDLERRIKIQLLFDDVQADPLQREKG
jgi:hypothetical protein